MFPCTWQRKRDTPGNASLSICQLRGPQKPLRCEESKTQLLQSVTSAHSTCRTRGAFCMHKQQKLLGKKMARKIQFVQHCTERAAPLLCPLPPTQESAAREVQLLFPLLGKCRVRFWCLPGTLPLTLCHDVFDQEVLNLRGAESFGLYFTSFMLGKFR